MSKLADLYYDIEQMYIEGISPRRIAQILECPIEVVFEWVDSESLSVKEEELDSNINS
jgi:transposase-like protein